MREPVDRKVTVPDLREKHAAFGQKHTKHKEAIEAIWRSFDATQRATCLRAGAAEGVVPRHRTDTPLTDAYKFTPEWCNLRDLTDSGPDFLLNLIKHRATTSLFQQYYQDDRGGPGDHDVVVELEQTRRLPSVQTTGREFILFLNGEHYVQPFSLMAGEEMPAHLLVLIRAGLSVPRSRGENILQRQLLLIYLLSGFIDKILRQGSQAKAIKETPKKSNKAASAALANLALPDRPPAEGSLFELIASALEQKTTLDEYLGLVYTEPALFAETVQIWVFTRPEMVADEQGRSNPANGDQDTGGAILAAAHSAVQGATVWDCICRLLELLGAQASDDEIHRAVSLQELANVCRFEFDRAQALFKRQVQRGTGVKFFQRQSGHRDRVGNARVITKCNLKKLAKRDVQLYYIMRLCQAEMTPKQAITWLKKLAEFNESDPAARERMSRREANALNDLTVIVSLIQDLSSTISMPSVLLKKGRIFVSRLQDLEAEVAQLKDQADLGFPSLDELLRPGRSEGALEKLDQLVLDKLGSKLGFLYEDLVDECFSVLENQYQLAKSKKEEQAKATAIAQQQIIDWASTHLTVPQPRAERIEQRSQKEKTRPAHSVHEITPAAEPPTAEEPAPSPQQTLEVSVSTAEVFSVLFDKTQSRGAVNWVDFVAAMGNDLGFSVVPKFGSVYTFLPPESMGVKQSLTVHRPHTSRIEGYRLLILARRLKRVYGWGEKTFVVI